MKRDAQVYLVDIKDSIFKIEEYTQKISQADFFDDTKIQDAVMRRITIIGEAIKHIPDEFRVQHPDIPWHDIAGMRDKLIHEYSGIKLGRVWDVIENDLPVFKRQVESLLKEFPSEK